MLNKVLCQATDRITFIMEGLPDTRAYSLDRRANE